MEFRGARYLHVLVPCPLGWGSAAADTIRIARLARETGLFPVFEAERGEVVHVSKIRGRVPVENYLARNDGSRICSASRPGRTSSNGSRPVPTGTSGASASSRRS